MPYTVVLLFVLFMDIVFIRLEEKRLEKAFDEAWAEYR